MKLASICIRNAKMKHNMAGVKAKYPSLYAKEEPISTGTAAPDRVLGLEAKIHAFTEFILISFIIHRLYYKDTLIE